MPAAARRARRTTLVDRHAAAVSVATKVQYRLQARESRMGLSMRTGGLDPMSGLMALSVAYYFMLPIGAAKANADIAVWGDAQSSFMGLEQPLIQLKNPGLLSIPLSFLAVLIGSLLFRDRRPQSMWNGAYVRQNTGLLVSKSVRL
jgi:cation/acetate symporter